MSAFLYQDVAFAPKYSKIGNIGFVTVRSLYDVFLRRRCR
jgi:hypothetical protein